MNETQLTRTIAPTFVNVQRWTEGVTLLITMTILLALYGASLYFEWKTWVSWLFVILLVLDIGMSVWTVGIAPILWQKYWRFHVDETYIQLRYGRLSYEHVVIPTAKIQSVRLQQGPFLRRYGLMAVTIDTLSDAHTIPALSTEEARILRDEIAHYAKVKEVA